MQDSWDAQSLSLRDSGFWTDFSMVTSAAANLLSAGGVSSAVAVALVIDAAIRRVARGEM